jgi:hypothetical protein
MSRHEEENIPIYLNAIPSKKQKEARFKLNTYPFTQTPYSEKEISFPSCSYTILVHIGVRSLIVSYISCLRPT